MTISYKKILCLIFVFVFGFLSLAITSDSAFAEPSGESAQQTQEAVAEPESCKYAELQKKYMEGSTCWYCLIVGKMTGAYLYSASLIMPTIKTLALMILRYGFLIWLALYILKQVSSLSPISTGKFLQEILIMGFKVMLATIVINNGIPFLNAYIITPLIDTGIDIGNSIFDELAQDFDNLEEGRS